MHRHFQLEPKASGTWLYCPPADSFTPVVLAQLYAATGVDKPEADSIQYFVVLCGVC
jgi:hypothetical protein